MFREVRSAKQEITIKKYHIVVILALSSIIFHSLYGIDVINPLNVNWLFGPDNGDSATAYISWEFFRLTEWNFPIGLNPRYGMELASTISYSDSIPLLAFIFKAILPHDISKFQYFGLWLFTCIFFQLYIAFLILYKMTRDVHLALLGSIFFVILPTFLLRTDVHFALAAHFLVLAALFLGYYGEISSKFCSWILLGVSSVLIHPYFTIIIIVFYFSFWVIHCLQHKFYFRLMGEALCFLLAVVLACYVIGLFELNFPSLEGRGLGAHTSSLIKLLIPLEDSSLFIPVPMYQFTSYEGLAYFGVGLMVLIFISLVNIRLVKLRARDLSLLLCALISLFLSSYP